MSIDIRALKRLHKARERDIRALEADCREQDGEREPLYLGCSLNFDGGMRSYFLLYDNKVLAGALVLFAPTRAQAEISALTRPGYRRKGCFTALFRKAEEELARCGVPEALLVCDRRSGDGFRAVSALGARLEHTEYTLGYAGGRPVLPSPPRLTLRGCTPADAQTLAGLNERIFGDPPDEARERARRDIASGEREQYLVMVEGSAAGMAAVGRHNGESSIYGVGLLAEYRGRGLGRELLGTLLARLLGRGETRIAIEVDSENEVAHGLYRSVGFAERSVIDYYRYPLAGAGENGR